MLVLLITVVISFTNVIAGNYATDCELDKCFKYYHPVCGQNSKGKTKSFTNECELRLYACKHEKEEWDLISHSVIRDNCIHRLVHLWHKKFEEDNVDTK